MQFDSDFTATNMLHPSTYLNKILVGSSQGSIQLWNIKTQCVICRVGRHEIIDIGVHRTKIHTFSYASLTAKSSKQANQPSIAITALVQSPAIDVVGVGFASGEISVYDVRADERLMKMTMQDGAVRSLSFRSGMFPYELPNLADAHASQMDSLSWRPRQPTGTSHYGT